MKRAKHILAVSIAAVMIMTMAVPAFAESSQQEESQQQISTEVQQVSGEYLVQYKDDIAKKTDIVEEELPEYDTNVVEAVTPDVQLIKADADLSAKEEETFIKDLEALDEVEFAEPNVIVKAAGTATTKQLEAYPQWGLSKIKAPEAWDMLDDPSKSVTVAVVDTGVDVTHPDLQGRVKNGKTFIKRNSKGKLYDPTKFTDDTGHGTQSAGVIAAEYGNNMGIDGAAGASDVSILPVKVLDDEGYGTLSDLVKGVKYAADQGADVINMSLGFYTYSVFMEKAVQYAQAKGCVLVASAGNEAVEAADFEKEYGIKLGIAYPAALDGVLAVGATRKDDSRASFSNYGENLDLMAPGLFVMSTLPQSIAKTANEEDLGEIYGNEESGYYLKFTGTSAAAPFVSAAAALYKLKNPDASGIQITNQLKTTAKDLGKTGFDTYTGYGLVDTQAAMTRAATAAPGRTTVKLQNKGVRSIQVSWSAVTGATGYDVYRASGIAGKYKKVKSVSAGSTLSFMNTNLATDTNYCYKVIAYKTAGGKKIQGIASDLAFCATSSFYVKLKGSSKSYKGINLSWSKSKKAKGYVVYRAEKKKGPYKKIKTLSSKTTHYMDKKTVSGKYYYYRVRGYLKENGKTVYSDYSNKLKRKAQLKRPVVELQSQWGSRMKVTWKEVSGAQGYQVYVSNKKYKNYKKAATIKDGDVTTYTSSKLKSGKKYYYKVRAYRVTAGKKGYSEYSAVKSKKL